MIDDEESHEIYKIGESKEDYLESEESETYERDQIENPESLKRIDSHKNRENNYPVDTDIDLEINVVKKKN